MPSRLLLLQPNLNPPGGVGGVAAWAIEALKRAYHIDLVTWQPPDLPSINRFYGTTLSAGDFRILAQPGPLLRRLFALDPDPMSFQPTAGLMRLGRWLRPRYSAVLSLCDEADLGAPVLQYVHYPYLLPKLARTGAAERLRPWRLLSGFDQQRMRANTTLVNSDWTGRVVQSCYGIPTTTLYPPAVGGREPAPWPTRANDFVSIGRITPPKRWELVLEILQGVRARGLPVRWHLVGTTSTRGPDRDYGLALRGLLARHSDWVSFLENLSRAELERLIAANRYGLHGLAEEHFGMAVAELVLGGCIVFVPDGGGQTEIVACEPRVIYRSVPEAVEKILQVLADPPGQQALQARLQAHARQFSTEHFKERLRNLVARHDGT